MAEAIDRVTRALAGRYEIEREVGRGGMATVYLARDVRHSRVVAIKVLREELSQGVAADRFLSEITIAAGLVHPNIIPVFDSGGDRDCLYYVMPYVEGETLRARLTREGRLPVEDALRIAREVGEALAYAHGCNVVHRDIKPENILLVQGHAVISDFGIARAIQQAGGERLTFTGLAVGTPLYMSPEQAIGSPDVDGRSDVFSLGCVLYEMISGDAPHAAATPQEVIARKFADSTGVLHTSLAGVSTTVDRAIKRALAVDASQRFHSAAEFVAMLGAPADATAVTLSPGARPRPRFLTAVAIGAAAVAVVAVTVIAVRGRSARLPGVESRAGVAVFPFHATAAGAVQWEEAIPDLLATTLDGIPGIAVADPWSLWRELRPDPHAHARSPAPDEAGTLAQRAGARYFILGSIAQLQNDVQVSIRVYRSGTHDPWQTFGVTGPADSMPRLLRDISLEAIRRLAIGVSAAAAPRLEQGLTRSPEALKAWLVARESRRRGQLDSADVAIDRALALDSTFVLGLIDAVTIKSWRQFSRGQAYDGLRDLAERAVRLSDSVPERARLHAKAILASINTDGATAALALNLVLAIDSTDFDAWSSLAYVQMSYGWQYGQGIADAIISAERAVRLDSTDSPALTRRAFLAVAANDVPDIQRQLTRLQHADTASSLVRGMLRGIDALQLDDRTFAQRVPLFAAGSVPEWITTLRMLRVYRPDRADLLLAHTRRLSAPVAAFAAGGTIQLLAAEGRWRALDSLRRAGAFAGIVNLDRQADRMEIAGAIGGAGDDQLARRAVASLSADLPPDSALSMFGRRSTWQDGWLIGAFHAMYGDTGVARAWERALGTLPTKNAHPARYTTALRDDLAARIASRRGDRANALLYAQRAYEEWDVHADNQFEFTPEPAIRFHRATLLRASGARDSAAALFRGLVPPTSWMGFYTTRAALELAELSDESRDVGAAQRYFLMASHYLERSDSSVAALRDRTRRGLARSAEGGRR